MVSEDSYSKVPLVWDWCVVDDEGIFERLVKIQNLSTSLIQPRKNNHTCWANNGINEANTTKKLKKDVKAYAFKINKY